MLKYVVDKMLVSADAKRPARMVDEGVPFIDRSELEFGGRSILAGHYFWVDEVKYKGADCVFKEYLHPDSTGRNAKMDISSCALALKNAHEAYPDHFPEVKGVVESKDGIWEGLVVELVKSPYLQMDNKSKITPDVMNKMKDVVINMHRKGIWCDVKETNVFLNDESDFIFIDPMYAFSVDNFADDLKMLDYFDRKHVMGAESTEKRVTLRNKMGAYKSMLDYLAHR